MYAIVKIGGHQYKVRERETIFVNKLNTEDKTVTFDDVYLVSDEKGKVSVGTPTVKGASVKAAIADQLKADKVIVFKKKRRKGYQKKNGFRQSITQLDIQKITS